MVEGCSRLKTRIDKVEGIMKETLGSMDKLQAELNEANTCKVVLENQGKTAKDQVALLHRQVLELQAQAEEARAASIRAAELETELQVTVAQVGEMFGKGQDSIKKEFVKMFPSEVFTWINDIFPKEEGDEMEEGEGQAEGIPHDRVFIDNVIDVEILM